MVVSSVGKYVALLSSFTGSKLSMGGLLLPDDNNDAIKDVVWVPYVSKQAESQQHEAHLQDKHAGEHYVADL